MAITLKPLALSAKAGAWRLYAMRRSDPRFKDLKAAVFERDHHTCQYCGFQGQQFQEVINLDGDYRNNTLANMLTACPFCAQCFFLESVGEHGYGGGTLIYLPDIDQAALNGLCHVLFCAMANATSYRANAQVIYNNLRLRSQVVEEKLGERMSTPSVLGRCVIDIRSNKDDEICKVMLESVRLLPARAAFTQEIEAWALTALDEMSLGHTAAS